jgi:spore coat polysaccharide biosynthesis protein SpsF
VIQARMGSARLPGKVLMPIGRAPLLGHVVGRLAGLRNSASIVVATSTESADDAIASWCALEGVRCFRGSELDVLARYYECANALGLDPIVRLTADNPFTDVEELDNLIDLHRAQGNDLTHSFRSLPVGVGAEILSFAALERSHREGHAAHHREHVDEYILENPRWFRSGMLETPQAKRRPDVRLTVDTDEDLRRARYVAERAPGPWCTTQEAIALCSHFA